MKKTFIAAALVGTMLLTGCSGVSQEEYNSLLSKNESLKSEKSEIESENRSSKIESSSSTVENSSSTAISSIVEESSSISEPLPSPSNEISIEAVKTLDGKVCAFITNMGTKTIDELDVQIQYKDFNGVVIDLDHDGHDMILPNQTVVSRFDAPSSYENYNLEYSSEYGVNPTYKNHLEECNVQSNLGENCVIIQVTNNSKTKIDEFEYIVVFYKGDDIASVSYPQDIYNIAPNKTVTEKNNFYKIDFDRFEVYVNQAHTFF